MVCKELPGGVVSVHKHVLPSHRYSHAHRKLLYYTACYPSKAVNDAFPLALVKVKEARYFTYLGVAVQPFYYLLTSGA